MEPQKFVIEGTVMGKPRMTRQDNWKKRDCVVRYRAWCDSARGQCPGIKADPIRIDWVAYLPIPPSWSEKKKKLMQGQLHQAKPDRDNIDKGILDALFEEDKGVACGYIEKRWDDGKGPRIELTIW